jgi:hypothetical protein
MVVIIVSVAIRGPQIDESLKGDQTDRWNFANPGVFEAIGVICKRSLNFLFKAGDLSLPPMIFQGLQLTGRISSFRIRLSSQLA